jgi:hypothetical protein
MTSRDFAFWLQGYFEVSNPKEIGEKETDLIKRHLALVFKHEIDPSMGDEAYQAGLNEIHGLPSFENSLPPTNGNGETVYRC